MIFIGVDWAEAHHDVCVLDAEGKVLGRKRILDSLAGVGELHALVADHLGDENDVNEVVVGIEKDRGLIVTALLQPPSLSTLPSGTPPQAVVPETQPPESALRELIRVR
jgi:hypothetical protein